MFKGILPSSKRISTSEFTIVSPPMDPLFNATGAVALGKENYNGFPQPPTLPPGKSTQKRKMSRSVPRDQPIENETNQAFDKLLDDLQVPSTIRPKLAGMESSVKAAMLKSSQTLSSASSPTVGRALRKAHSSDSLSPPHIFKHSVDHDDTHAQIAERLAGTAVPAESSMTHSRGISVDSPRPKSRASAPFGNSGETAFKSKTKDKPSKNAWTPVKFCSFLDNTSSALLEVEVVKKLRLLLRNEAASWTEEFLQEGGYDALLARLNEILEFEWREEQHDDQLLHALLQCFKALSTSDVGCAAIRSSYPSPFIQLVTLIYSDKKPGEVGTRQLIVEFLLLLFDLYPSNSLPSSEAPSGRRLELWQDQNPFLSSNLVILPSPHKTVFSLARSLLLTPAPRAAEAPEVPLSPHEFIENLHRPRIYKTYLQELSDICRDFFWVFCHPNNTIWNLRECDETKAERPRAPGGMTGGVEAEAMRYMTTHFKFVNLIARSASELHLPKEHEHSAYMFHSDLFLSGIERMILIARKASTLYYPTLHLEIARYIQSVSMARYELPWSVSRLIGPPPSSMCKSPSTNDSARNTPPTPPSRRASSKRVAPLNLDAIMGVRPNNAI